MKFELRSVFFQGLCSFHLTTLPSGQLFTAFLQDDSHDRQLHGSFIVMAMDNSYPLSPTYKVYLSASESYLISGRMPNSYIYISVHIKLQIKELGYCIDFKKELQYFSALPVDRQNLFFHPESEQVLVTSFGQQNVVEVTVNLF